MSHTAYRFGAYAMIGGAIALSMIAGCDKQSVPVRPDFQNTYEVPPIEILSITPSEGLAGDLVYITGSGFDSTLAQNRAYIGGAGVEVVDATDSTMTLRIPIWASSGTVRITDALGWRVGTSTDVFAVKAPSTLDNGYTGSPGQPTITSNQADSSGVGAATTTTVVSGSVSAQDGDGYWAIAESDGTVRSMGRLGAGTGTYVQTIPIFCGRQYMLRFFSNAQGRAFYRTELMRSGCTEAGLRVQLAWDTDSTDVDLHLIKPNGTYTGQDGSDCYFANSNPDWGTAGDPADNPELDVDDVNGFGPENIYLDPGENGTYRVTVHYWSANGHGPSDAWVEIFVDGQRAGSFGPYTLPTTGAIWQVADVEWPGGTVTPVQIGREADEPVDAAPRMHVTK